MGFKTKGERIEAEHYRAVASSALADIEKSYLYDHMGRAKAIADDVILDKAIKEAVPKKNRVSAVRLLHKLQTTQDKEGLEDTINQLQKYLGYERNKNNPKLWNYVGV